MTIKLYETHGDMQTFESQVLSCTPCKQGYAVELSQTAFFPEGGGQLGDQGYLGDARVSDTQIIDGTILHYTDRPLEEGPITGTVDWSIRFPRMQNHSGEHLFSGLVHGIFGYENVGFHMNDLSMTIDFSGTLSKDQLTALEQKANTIIWENRGITVSFPSETEQKQISYRSKLDHVDNLRLVTIEDTDCCACCAPHLSSTGPIGFIKVLDSCPWRGGTRVELICGTNALQDYEALHKQNGKIMQLLSAKRMETFQEAEAIVTSLSQTKYQMQELKNKLAAVSLQQYASPLGILAVCSASGYEEMRSCLSKISLPEEGCLYLFASVENTSDEGFLYLVNGTQPVKEAVSNLNRSLQGRGGGRDTFAQGKVQCSKKDLLQYFGVTAE